MKHNSRTDEANEAELLKPVIARRQANLPEVGEDAPSKLSPDIGKYRGVPIRDIPTPYLHWLTTEFEPYPSQRYFVAAAVLELKHRRMDAT